MYITNKINYIVLLLLSIALEGCCKTTDIASAVTEQVSDDEQNDEITLPMMTEWQVETPTFLAGADACPTSIASVTAPFEMSTPQQPEINKDTVTVLLKGAETPSASSINRKAIQCVIDSIAEKGGGVVIIPSGEWQTGRIELRSGINLHLVDGARLEFSGEVKDYLPVVFTRDEGVELNSLGACIYARDAHDIALTGKGHIIGASTDSELYTKKAKDAEELFGLTVTADNWINQTNIQAIPVEARILDGDSAHFGGGIKLPKSFSPINCKRILVEGVTFDQGIYWNIVPQYCSDVTIRGVSVNSYGHGTTDGIDIDSSEDVLIEYCTMDCQDDCYCMKSGRGLDALRVAKPTQRVVMRNSIALRGGGGIVCGTETGGGIHNIYCSDCVFNGTDQAVRLKTRRPRGGMSDGIYVDNIFASNIEHSAIKVEMLGSTQYVGQLAIRYPAPQVNKLTPGYKNIHISHMYVDGCEKFVNVVGLPESPLSSMTIDNATMKCDSAGTITDAKDISFNDVRLYTNDPTIKLDNVK